MPPYCEEKGVVIMRSGRRLAVGRAGGKENEKKEKRKEKTGNFPLHV